MLHARLFALAVFQCGVPAGLAWNGILGYVQTSRRRRRTKLVGRVVVILEGGFASLIFPCCVCAVRSDLPFELCVASFAGVDFGSPSTCLRLAGVSTRLTTRAVDAKQTKTAIE